MTKLGVESILYSCDTCAHYSTHPSSCPLRILPILIGFDLFQVDFAFSVTASSTNDDLLCLQFHSWNHRYQISGVLLQSTRFFTFQRFSREYAIYNWSKYTICLSKEIPALDTFSCKHCMKGCARSCGNKNQH